MQRGHAICLSCATKGQATLLPCWLWGLAYRQRVLFLSTLLCSRSARFEHHNLRHLSISPNPSQPSFDTDNHHASDQPRSWCDLVRSDDNHHLEEQSGSAGTTLSVGAGRYDRRLLASVLTEYWTAHYDVSDERNNDLHIPLGNAGAEPHLLRLE